MRPVRTLVTAALAASVGLPVLLIGGMSTTASAAPAPLTIALLNDVTGSGAGNNVGTNGVFNAAIDAANAAGGVHGHKLVGQIIDTQTSPGSAATGAQEAIQNGDIGMVSNSYLMFLVAQYPNKANMPVTGFSSDGKEWGQYTNMFAGDTGSNSTNTPINTMYGKLAKMDGAKNVALYTLNVNATGNNFQSYSFDKVYPQAKVVLQDNSVPYGQPANFGPTALVAKQNNVDWMWSNLDGTSNIALVTAYKQAGVPTKHIYLPDGYSDTLPKSPAWHDVQGADFEAVFHPFSVPNAGTEQMQSALEKYAGWTSANFPSYAQDEVWLNTELMIKGLENAGSNPTRASTVTALRNITNWNANGLLPYTINYKTIFGHVPAETCIWIEKAEQKGFVLQDTQPVCGNYLAGTSTNSKY
jgi:branched-chain amino acid transport system substrate-binding protein